MKHSIWNTIKEVWAGKKETVREFEKNRRIDIENFIESQKWQGLSLTQYLIFFFLAILLLLSVYIKGNQIHNQSKKPRFTINEVYNFKKNIYKVVYASKVKNKPKNILKVSQKSNNISVKLKSDIHIITIKQPSNFNQIYISAGSKFGIDWHILAAIHSVESGQRGNTTITSYAGAQGPMQFMPSTWRRYGIDGDGDGIAKINSVIDAIYGAAHYLSANYAKSGSIYQAIYAYNHSAVYVNKVLTIARSFGYTG